MKTLTKVAVLVVATAAVLMAAATYFLRGFGSSAAAPENLSASKPRDESRGSHSSDELRSLKAELGILKARLNGHDQRAALADAQQVTAEAPSKDGESRGTWEERMAAHSERDSRRRSAVEAALRLEPRDVAWASSTEHNVQVRVADLDDERFPTTLLDHVECKQTICEVTARHESVREAEAFLEAIVGIDTIRQTFGRTIEESPGSYVTTVFLGKRGHPLPKPAE